ncbi:MAG: hypothetical protein CBC55_04495 [Gammaproteobacteria bacterium TMED95]|nr:MAG: hypothetical protein CBC55_04495 [Gammaproteobacteria bacterium TMED95]
MIANFFRKFLTIKNKKTHMLFCIPRNEGAMGPLPQFYALPIDGDETVYFFNPSESLADFDQKAITTWYIEGTKNSAITFATSGESISEFTSMFGRYLEKPHEDFKANELAYFGAGNFGFCLGPAHLKGGNQQPTFILKP